MSKPTTMQLTITPFHDAKIISKTLERHNPQAAREYLEKFHLRQSIERAAVNSLYALY